MPGPPTPSSGTSIDMPLSFSDMEPSTRRFKLTLARHSTTDDPHESTTYPSRPLQHGEFRLIRLHPGRYGRPISCDIIIYSLELSNLTDHSEWDATCNFEALSYAWGPSHKQCTIRVNACFTMQVTDNLQYALQRLRNKREVRWLWIDAIAINQGDNEEKAHQVARMIDIYRCAKRTLVWLGEPHRSILHRPVKQGVSLCKASLKSSAAVLSNYWESLNTFNTPNRAPRGARRIVPFHFQFGSLDAALAAADTLWSERAWVIQEVHDAIRASRIAFHFGGTSAISGSSLN